MSFFTSNAYASFHQHLPPKMQGLQADSRVTAMSPSSSTRAPTATTGGTPVAKQLSPQKHAASKSRSVNSSTTSVFTGDRLLDNTSFMSASSTASTTSEYDPLSPLHTTDPWLLTPTSAAGSASALSLKVYDQVDDDEEWGEFINSSSSSSEHAQAFREDNAEGTKSDTDPTARGTSKTSSTRRANRAARREKEGDNRQRLPSTRSERAYSNNSDDGQQRQCVPKSMPRATYSALPYQQQPQAWGSGIPTTSPFASPSERRPSSSNSTFDTFANAVLSRLSSFRSEHKTQQPHATASWSTRLFSDSDEIDPSTSMPTRGYDSYDITFERGPIGLELETDWYGRQAVVKGFKSVTLSGDDGPARQCGIIRIGDVLTAIDGESCLEMSFQETLAKLRAVSGRRHVLHFKSLEAAGDLSVYESSEMDIIQAKRFIHEHKEKFYRPPTSALSTAASGTASSSSSRAHQGLILGCVERLRGESVTAFNLHREDTGEFVLACSCVNDATGVFVFHTLQDSHLRDFEALPRSEDSAVYLGQMIPNFLGTEFTILDHQQTRRNELGFLVYSSNVLGRVPNFLKCVFPRQPPIDGDEDSDDGLDGSSTTEATHGDAAAVPAHRPRAATSMVPGSDRTFRAASTQRHDSMMVRNGSIAERYKHAKQQRRLSLIERLRHFSLDDLDTSLAYAGGHLDALWHDADDHDASHRSRSMQLTPGHGVSIEQTDYHCDLVTFETKKPAWNDELGAWTLNFHGRVKMASKKNFLLVPEQGNDSMETEFGDDRVALRFGKVSKSRFSLDYQAPISPMLALAIVCSSFAHKIAVT